MSTDTAEAPKKNRTVLDQHGQSYELTGCLGEGGQGIVCTTNYPNVLVKIARALRKSSDPAGRTRSAHSCVSHLTVFRSHIRWLL